MSAPGGIGSFGAASPLKSEILGSGSYGSVIKPALTDNIGGVHTEFPDNVTKVFYHKKNYNNMVSKKNLIRDVMGANDGHRINLYTRKYKRANSGENLYILRMPDLGKDFSKVNDYVVNVRRIPLEKILEQITKLLTQLKNLESSGFIHGDIRSKNIMFNPNTGDITIIDFDLLQPKADFHDKYASSYGYYSHPPESLLFNTGDTSASKYADIFPPDRPFLVRDTEKWCERQYTYYNDYYTSVGITSIPLLEREIFNANNKNLEAIKSLYSGSLPSNKEAAIRTMLPTFDGYGLAIALLNFLVIVYTPNIIAKKSDDSIEPLISALKSIGVTKNGEAYTSKELHDYSRALFSMVNVLRYMARINVQFRLHPGDALGRALTIMDTLHSDLAKPESAKGGKRKTHRVRRRRFLHSRKP